MPEVVRFHQLGGPEILSWKSCRRNVMVQAKLGADPGIGVNRTESMFYRG
jgi:hypothetical protein